MAFTTSVKFSVFASAFLALGLLVSPTGGHAKDLKVINLASGGFEVQFPNGCSIEYDGYGNRGRSSGGCKNHQYDRADDAIRAELNPNSHSYQNDSGTWYSRLVGANGSGAETQMENHGFRYADAFESGRNSRGTIWYNESSRQCLQMIVVDGRVDSVVDIQTHPSCNSHGGGYGSDNGTWYSRLVGASSDGAKSQLDMHGFHQVDSFDSGNNGYGLVWFNDSSRQCLQVIVVNGRVDSAVDIQSHPKCRR